MRPTAPQSTAPLKGIALMAVAMAVLPFLDVVAKILGQQGVPILQIVWARMALGCALTLPLALRLAGPRGLIPDRPMFHALRAGFLIGATGLFFWAPKFLAIADALAIFFVQPLIVTALSPFILGEYVGPRRWAAVAVGLCGTLIILRPGFGVVNPGSLLALGAGGCLAIYMLMTRKMSGRFHALVTTFHTNLAGGILTTALVPLVWQTPSLSQWGLFGLLAFFAVFGHYLIVRAYDQAQASLLAPMAYTEIIMATVVGWWFFGDFPDGWTFTGVGILIASAIYISWREHSHKTQPPEASG